MRRWLPAIICALTAAGCGQQQPPSAAELAAQESVGNYTDALEARCARLNGGKLCLDPDDFRLDPADFPDPADYDVQVDVYPDPRGYFP